MPYSTYPIQQADGFSYIDEGPASERPPVVLLHGMLGDLSNWSATVSSLAEHGHRVLVPVLPVYALPVRQTHVAGLVDYTRQFLEALALDPVILIGNSLGGHIALLYTLEYPGSVRALVLSGSSGIYEVEMGTSMLRRGDRNFIRERAALTFYDPAHATDELVDEMFEVVNDRSAALRLIRMARSAQKETVTERLPAITQPTLLVWGRNDVITPPDVAEEFRQRIPHAQLRFIDECGHAPMIEHPELFNKYTVDFLEAVSGDQAVPQRSSTLD